MAKTPATGSARQPARTTRQPVRATGRRIPAQSLAAGDSSYDIRFGVILDINGSPVPITSGDLKTAKEQGVEFTLQNPVGLGSIDKFETWVGKQFGVTMPTAADLPPPLDKVVGAITSMEITVEKAHVKIPGTKSTDQNVGITLEVNGTFVPEIQLIDGKLGIEGLVFGFSNETSGS
jgi:hypothetical protein